MDDRDLYDQAAERHPTALLVDSDALARATRLFGEDPETLKGSWLHDSFCADREDR